MKIVSKEELLQLDEDLQLFDEQDWSFLNTEVGNNVEYFNDILDNDFRKRNIKDFVTYTLLTVLACSLFIISGTYLYNSTVGRYILTKDYDKTLFQDRIVKLERVKDCIQADTDQVAKIQGVLKSYFNILKNESSYDILNGFCESESTFYNKQQKYLSKMEHSLDTNDCYARGIRCMGSCYSMSKINEVLVKDKIYYVYLNVNYPDNDSLSEYFYTYSGNLQKYFISYNISEGNVIRWLTDIQNTYGIPTTENEICLEMIRNSRGDFVIRNDSIITDRCVEAYEFSMAQILKQLGAGKLVNQYE